MGIKATAETDFGEDRELYIRLNSIDDLSNHGMPAKALFRGFLSQQHYEDGKRYVWEREVTFLPDVALPLWPQAYGALKAADEVPGAVDDVSLNDAG